MAAPKVSRRYLPNEEKQRGAIKMLVRFDGSCRKAPADLGKIEAGPDQRPPKGRIK
jgi:hypothetical protein